MLRMDQKDSHALNNEYKPPLCEIPQSPHMNNSDSSAVSDVNKEFKLAPTPAQLGKAPLQRRQSLGENTD